MLGYRSNLKPVVNAEKVIFIIVNRGHQQQMTIHIIVVFLDYQYINICRKKTKKNEA